jgi:hypothetical protein
MNNSGYDSIHDTRRYVKGRWSKNTLHPAGLDAGFVLNAVSGPRPP